MQYSVAETTRSNGKPEPLGELGVGEVGEIFDGEGGMAADFFEGQAGGDAEDA